MVLIFWMNIDLLLVVHTVILKEILQLSLSSLIKGTMIS